MKPAESGIAPSTYIALHLVSPDLVVEVLSPSTATHDHLVKRQVYERAGVTEFWLVHPTDRMVTIYRLVDGAYGKPDVQELSGTTPVGVLPGIAVAWNELVTRWSQLATIG